MELPDCIHANKEYKCKLMFDSSIKEDDLWIFGTAYCGWHDLKADPRDHCEHYEAKGDE